MEAFRFLAPTPAELFSIQKIISGYKFNFHCHFFHHQHKHNTKRQEASNKMATATWNGTAMTQKDMMEKDTVLVLDDKDNVIGSESKRGSHEFTPSTPHAILHRAFSVFLFDKETGDLLLQKRASTKITFPNVRHLLCDGGFACTCFKEARRQPMRMTRQYLSFIYPLTYYVYS